ncbi:hypothetical protein ACFP3I_11325 [Chryseobacterium arachidis]|uniref:hypothetical protein n=1 Tax=Chryseobacterium arachidis TaxID=1416778 RepID=UPI00361203A5
MLPRSEKEAMLRCILALSMLSGAGIGATLFNQTIGYFRGGDFQIFFCLLQVFSIRLLLCTG